MFRRQIRISKWRRPLVSAPNPNLKKKKKMGATDFFFPQIRIFQNVRQFQMSILTARWHEPVPDEPHPIRGSKWSPAAAAATTARNCRQPGALLLQPTVFSFPAGRRRRHRRRRRGYHEEPSQNIRRNIRRHVNLNEKKKKRITKSFFFFNCNNFFLFCSYFPCPRTFWFAILFSHITHYI